MIIWLMFEPYSILDYEIFDFLRVIIYKIKKGHYQYLESIDGVGNKYVTYENYLRKSYKSLQLGKNRKVLQQKQKFYNNGNKLFFNIYIYISFGMNNGHIDLYII